MPLSLYVMPRRPTSTLFPYTTLFRSKHVPIMRRAKPQPIDTRLPRLRNAKPKKHDGRAARDRKSSEATRSRTSHGRTFRLRSEEHTSELQSLAYLVCRLLLEKKKHIR